MKSYEERMEKWNEIIAKNQMDLPYFLEMFKLRAEECLRSGKIVEKFFEDFILKSFDYKVTDEQFRVVINKVAGMYFENTKLYGKFLAKQLFKISRQKITEQENKEHIFNTPMHKTCVSVMVGAIVNNYLNFFLFGDTTEPTHLDKRVYRLFFFLNGLYELGIPRLNKRIKNHIKDLISPRRTRNDGSYVLTEDMLEYAICEIELCGGFLDFLIKGLGILADDPWLQKKRIQFLKNIKFDRCSPDEIQNITYYANSVIAGEVDKKKLMEGCKNAVKRNVQEFKEKIQLINEIMKTIEESFVYMQANQEIISCSFPENKQCKFPEIKLIFYGSKKYVRINWRFITCIVVPEKFCDNSFRLDALPDILINLNMHYLKTFLMSLNRAPIHE